MGIFLLVIGVLIGAVGVTAFMYIDPNHILLFGGPVNFEEARLIQASSIGLMVLGGGLALGGIIKIIRK
jgi:hypothetical protein